MQAFKVPPDLDKAILDFDRADGQIDLDDVQKSVVAVRTALGKVDEETNNACWAEALAFSLAVDLPGSCPWGTYFAPVGRFTDEKGNPVYSPDIAGTDPKTIEQWQWRASTVSHPVLRARYADLVWDLTTAIASRKPNYEFAKIAIDSYLAAVDKELYADDYDCFTACERALDVAESLKDEARIDSARATLLGIHRKVISEGKPLWWKAPDRLLTDKFARTTEVEKQELADALEKIVAAKSDIADPKTFDPHQTESAAKRLIGYYQKSGKSSEAKRLQKVIGATFESAASIAGGMVASSFLQTAVNAYKAAGDKDRVARTRVSMESAIGRAQDEMQSHTFSHEISREDMDAFLDTIVVADEAATMIRLAVEFLPARAGLEQRVKEAAKDAPLSAIITHTLMADDRVTAVIGSVEEDLAGRTVSQAAQEMSFGDVFLIAALERTVEKHSFTSHHFASWAAQSGLFEDLTLLYEGIDAWYAGDYVKALHVLVPQVEHAMRSIAIANGQPATKAHRVIQGASVAIGMGDILGNQRVLAVLGDDLALHFQALYADPRGVNLRNELAHGLMKPSSLTYGLTCRVIHTLLVLGVWSQIAKSRKKKAEKNEVPTPAQ